jgi:septum formation protein
LKRTGKAQPRVILASHSPRRRELLRLLNVPFRVVAPEVQELGDILSSAAALASALAQRKAVSVATGSSADLIIAADTLVVLDTQVMGKPTNPDSAREMLTALRGREHTVITGLAVLRRLDMASEVQAAETRVWMRNYSPEEVAEYIATGAPFDKAGAYAIQDRTFRPVEVIDGCYASVMGLPLCHLFGALGRLGLHLPAPPQIACEVYLERRCVVAQLILGAADH